MGIVKYLDVSRQPALDGLRHWLSNAVAHENPRDVMRVHPLSGSPLHSTLTASISMPLRGGRDALWPFQRPLGALSYLVVGSVLAEVQ